jgi:hypothetical protein
VKRIVKATYLLFVGLFMASSMVAVVDAQQTDPLRDRQQILPDGGAEEDNPIFIKVGQAGFTFMKLPTNARNAALGDAGVGQIGSGAAGVFLNPATLAFFEGREAFATHVEWIAGTKAEVIGAAFNLQGRGTIGIGFQTYDAGTFNATSIDTDPAGNGFTNDGTFSTSNYAITAGYGLKITDRFAIGANFKLAHQDLGNGSVLVGGNLTTISNSKNAFAFDLGTYFNTGFRNTVLAMSVQNFSQELTYQRESFELPRNIRLGVLVDVLSIAGNTPVPHHLNLAFDITNPVDFDEQVLAGLEYTFQAAGSPLGFSGRGGYKTNHDTESFSFGGGLKYLTEAGKGLKIDYAYKKFDANFFSSVHVVTAAIDF